MANMLKETLSDQYLFYCTFQQVLFAKFLELQVKSVSSPQTIWKAIYLVHILKIKYTLVFLY